METASSLLMMLPHMAVHWQNDKSISQVSDVLGWVIPFTNRPKIIVIIECLDLTWIPVTRT